MKKADVKIGGKYTAKVSDKLTTVRIDAENAHGGWDATNVATGKKVRIKSAQRLRGPATPAARGAKKAAGARGPAAVKAFLDKHTGASAAPVPPGAKKEARIAKDTTKKTGRQTGERGAKTGKKPGLLSAAVQVLRKLKRPMSAKEMVEQVQANQLWEPSRGGKTPDRTLYSAILREIQNKGDASRFQKTERGQFALK